MEISVIVPTLRRPETLERCLDALAQQEHAPAEVLVVHQATDELTRAALESLDPDAPPVRAVPVSRPGLVAALNAGLGAADRDIVAITDDDARPRPDWLRRIAETFADDDRIAAVGGRDWIWRDGRWIDQESAVDVGRVQWFGRVIGNHHMGVGGPRDVDVLKGVNMSFRRSSLGSLGFDTRLRGAGTQMNTELSVCLPLRSRGARIVYDPAIRVDHFPAERPAGARREAPSFEALVDTVHNETLAVLEFLPRRRHWAFAAWSVLIGARGAPGLGQMVRLALSGDTASTQQLRATLRGRWLGWRTYRAGRAR
jgi:cellulose synthase/poly-beta-1,6-N-acetylglucosamine synthase-like glycosyltransferase